MPKRAENVVLPDLKPCYRWPCGVIFGMYTKEPLPGPLSACGADLR